MNELTTANLAVQIISEIDKLEQEIYSHKMLSEKLEIANKDEYIGLATELTKIKRLGKELKAKEDELLEPFKRVIDNVKSKNKEYINLALQIEKSIKDAMVSWDTGQEELRRAEEARLRKLEEDRIAKERAKLEKKIETAENKGNEDKADELRMQAESLVPIVAQVEKDTPQIDTVKYTTRYDFEITDVNAIPRKYMIPDEKLIRKVVIAMKEQTDIAGIRVIKTRSLASK